MLNNSKVGNVTTRIARLRSNTNGKDSKKFPVVTFIKNMAGKNKISGNKNGVGQKKAKGAINKNMAISLFLSKNLNKESRLKFNLRFLPL